MFVLLFPDNQSDTSSANTFYSPAEGPDSPTQPARSCSTYGPCPGIMYTFAVPPDPAPPVPEHLLEGDETYVPVFYSLDATDEDKHYIRFDEGKTLPAGSPMLQQPGGPRAKSVYNPQSDPTTGSDSSSGMRSSINPLFNHLVSQPGAPRFNLPDNPSAFQIQPLISNGQGC